MMRKRVTCEYHSIPITKLDPFGNLYCPDCFIPKEIPAAGTNVKMLHYDHPFLERLYLMLNYHYFQPYVDPFPKPSTSRILLIRQKNKPDVSLAEMLEACSGESCEDCCYKDPENTHRCEVIVESVLPPDCSLTEVKLLLTSIGFSEYDIETLMEWVYKTYPSLKTLLRKEGLSA